MLRRRIFSSAMASVMALSAVAVVAQAEETTNQVVTEEQLKELVEVTFGANYRADELDNYGKASADAMLDALEAAEAILADKDADEEDFTVAYQMVMACEKRLTQHTLEELKALLDDAQAELDTNNIFNEELMDQIYNPEYFGNLEDAVDRASSYLTSTSAGDIADAFDDLNYHYNELLSHANTKISKSEYRNILKQYEAILADQFEYDSWRRGTVAGAGFSNGSGTWSYMNSATTAAFGAFYDYCVAQQEFIKDRYDMIDEIKGLTVTTDGDIIEGYNMAADLVKLFNAWSADSSSKATKSGVKSLLDKYHGPLVYDFAKQDVEDLAAAIDAVTADMTLSEETPAASGSAIVTFTDDDVDPAIYNWTAGATNKSVGGTLEIAIPQSANSLKVGDLLKIQDTADEYKTAGYFYVTKADNVKADNWNIVPANATSATEPAFEGYQLSVSATEIESGVVVSGSTITRTEVVGKNDAGTEWYYHEFVTTATPGSTDVVLDGNQWKTTTANVGNANWWQSTRLIGAEYIIKPTNSNLYIPLTADGYWDDAGMIVVDKSQRLDGVKYQAIAKNSKFDLVDLIAVDSSLVTNELYTMDGNTPAVIAGNASIDDMDEMATALYENTGDTDYSIKLKDAMKIAEDYLAGNYNVDTDGDGEADFMQLLDETGVVATGKNATGVSKEWVLVYRALEYALTDRYEGTAQGEFYTKADVKDLIEDAYTLVNDTGDAAIFNLSNVDLVEARQAAISWVAAAESDRLYKDGQSGKDADGLTYSDSTSAYKALKAKFDTLNAEFNALKYSYGDVYNKLADTAARIDDNELAATDELLAAMDEVAYRLSIMPDVTNTSAGDYEDNYAFDVDRVFNENNRVVTNKTDSDNNLVNIATIAEELDAETAKVRCWSWGPNTAHYNLLTAIESLDAAIAAQAKADVLLGDANGDGAVTAADASAILKYAVGLAEIDTAAADYNADGAVTAADASAILKALVS